MSSRATRRREQAFEAFAEALYDKLGDLVRLDQLWRTYLERSY